MPLNVKLSVKMGLIIFGVFAMGKWKIDVLGRGELVFWDKNTAIS